MNNRVQVRGASYKSSNREVLIRGAKNGNKVPIRGASKN